MIVTPGEPEGIIPHRSDIDPFEVARDAPLKNQATAGELFHARGAGAVFPQVPGRIGAEVPVIPFYVGLPGTDPLDTLRHQVWQGCFLPSLELVFIPQPMP